MGCLVSAGHFKIMKLKKSQFNFVMKSVAGKSKTPPSEETVKQMVSNYLCECPVTKVAYSDLVRSQQWVDRFKKAMREIGIDEPIKVRSGTHMTKPVPFSNENAHLFATMQNAIVMRRWAVKPSVCNKA